MIVVDTNIIAYLFINSEYSPLVEEVLYKDPMWAAPLLWRSEFRNFLSYYLRKALLTLPDTLDIMGNAMDIMRGREYEVTSSRVMELVDSSSCSAYDCEFVALAGDLQVSFLTTDRQIRENFPEISVAPDEFLESK